MITEDLLREALAVEAERYDLPPDGPAAILDAAAAPRPRWRPTMPRPVFLAGGALAMVVGIAGVGAVIADRADDKPSVAVSSDQGPTEPDQLVLVGRDAGLPAIPSAVPKPAPVAPGVAPPASDGRAQFSSRTSGVTTSGQMAGAPQPATGQPAAKDDARVIKTGQLQLEVDEGKVGAAVERLTFFAKQFQGYVASSQSVTVGDQPTAKISLRVPVASFDSLLGQAAALGKPLSQSTQGQDVTAQFADNEARLRALVATRTQFQTLLARARSIGEVLSVQQQITTVQTQIEQLQGQQKLLTDRTTYATLEVALSEPGDPVSKPLTTEKRSGFSRAWHDAVDNFTGGIEWVVAASGMVAFLLLLAVALAVVGRAGWRLWSRRYL